MLNQNLCPHSTEDSNTPPDSPDDSIESIQNSNIDTDQKPKFPGDDSNVGDNPIYPNKDDLIPVNDLDVDDENKSLPDNQDSVEIDHKVGSTQGGVYPYNINSNTSDVDENGEYLDKKAWSNRFN